MCPFCITAIAVAAAKVVSAGGGGAVAARLAFRKRADIVAAEKLAAEAAQTTAIEDSRDVPSALFAAGDAGSRREHLSL